MKQVPATSAESDALSKDLKKRGFRFVGSTIIYAHMQATGIVNDHTVGCFRRADCVKLAATISASRKPMMEASLNSAARRMISGVISRN
jgi:hypothetical protein